MSALKRNGVAAMIMFACIVLALVIGKMRQTTYEGPKPGSDQGSSIVSETIYDMSTFGSIKKNINEGLEGLSVIHHNNTVDASEDAKEDSLGFGSIVLIIIVVMIVFKIFGGRNK